ncbi:MAG TPA: sialate O-acetylesterase [Bacteroidales bacterium]|jgi:sialate O-acetylesterase|nr:sialate O-acetylesterase [Bacteroidales bacterium]
MRKIIKLACVGLILSLSSLLFTVNAEVKMPAIFGDNMVLQQQSDVAIWGWAKANSQVRVVTSWNKKSYSTRSDGQGYWKLTVKTPAAGFTPYTITVSDGQSITLDNVLIGEVWVCSGQSNMEMPMKGFTDQPIEGGPEAIATSTNPGIRHFTVKKASKAAPQEDCEGIWEIAGPGTTPNFTATGYFFGRLLNQALNVPVGLIHTSWGGSRIEAWMTSSSIKSVIADVEIPATDAEIKSQNGSPTVLYNGMLHPIVGYGIRGAIWYQGESNRGEPARYVELFDKMVREWRAIWEVGEFPFYYCQIAPFNYGGGLNSGYIREAQAKGMKTTPNTGMAVLMDSDSPGCIHPPKKREAGERMALWALAETYGVEGIHYRSPEVESLTIEGRVAIITMDLPAHPGLTTHGKEIYQFQIAGENKSFYPAKAALVRNQIFVFSPHVKNPVAVRYCFNDTADTEIFTVEGNLPVSSFRTDDW